MFIKNQNKILILFFEFFKISLFTIGGGLAMIPIIEDIFVKKRKLLQEEDITDMISITQTIPGLIAINSAIFVGGKLVGWKGSLAATAGVILPSMIIIVLLAMFFPLERIVDIHVIKAFSCVRACVLGIFIVLAYRVGKTLIKSGRDVILLCFLLILLFCKLHPAIIVIIACLFGGMYEMFIKQKQGVNNK